MRESGENIALNAKYPQEIDAMRNFTMKPLGIVYPGATGELR